MRFLYTMYPAVVRAFLTLLEDNIYKALPHSLNH